MWSQLFQRGLKINGKSTKGEVKQPIEAQDAVEQAKRKVLEAKMKLLQGKMDVARAKSYAQTARYRAIQAKKTLTKRQAKQPALIAPKATPSQRQTPQPVAKPTIDIFNAKRKQAWMVAEELLKKHPESLNTPAGLVFSFGQPQGKDGVPMASPFATVSAVM